MAATLLNIHEFLFIPFDVIELATNNFSDECLLAEGSTFKVYKGKPLSRGWNMGWSIVARECVQENVMFNEMMFSKLLSHRNVVSLYKFTYPPSGDTMFYIYKYETNESLNKHLSDTTLTWMQRLRICVGVADVLKYLHYDAIDNHYVIHGNVKSSKILLDHNWEPKLNGFGFAVKVKKNQVYLTSKYNGSLQYMDPAYESSRGLTHKSDIFSFGVMLFEVLFGAGRSNHKKQ